jgi:hypothetical protein
MRLLILLESLLIIGLAAAILLQGGRGPAAEPSGEVFAFNAFLGDAMPGEKATYRTDLGETIDFVVGPVDRGGPTGLPWASVTRAMRDAAGISIQEPVAEYHHFFYKHGILPFLTPGEPDALDRVWVVRRIRRAELDWRGRKLRCWRVECIDPGLRPTEDAIEVWLHEEVPVYGILRWQRQGRTYDCISWKGPS